MCISVVGENEFLDEQVVKPEMEYRRFVAKAEKTLFLGRQSDDMEILIGLCFNEIVVFFGQVLASALKSIEKQVGEGAHQSFFPDLECPVEISNVEFDTVVIDNQISTIVKFGAKFVGGHKLEFPVAVGDVARCYQMPCDVGLESGHFHVGLFDVS